ncbi:diacylglycerol/lipid kinase family protein [Rubrolithibacter danxiaensis]|uniref:diacylglycerol/lipid kinase family protein n=1 Tax=Rubrolithibacter danxiaensis TaxID=3390805 RepID=UPI003BF8AB70
MLEKKRIQFIINPISGGKGKNNIPQLVKLYLNKDKFNYHFSFTEHVGHAQKLASETLHAGTDIVVAVGGDGTINEVASAVAGTGKVMGIIPCGSGNGLARSLKIPLKKEHAIKKLNNLHTTYIDSATFNSRNFFNMAGIGFDAHISSVFSRERTRGFKGYIKTTLTEIAHYKSQHYLIEIDGKKIEREAFMLSIANSSQFGNNAHISPKASLFDGLVDVCIIKPFPLYKFPLMGWHMFSKTAHHSRYVEIIKGRKLHIVREKADAVHLDGEPVQMGKEIDVEVIPHSVGILI